MCRLEQRLERLKQTSAGANAPKIDELKLMIVDVVDFSNSKPDGIASSDFTTKITQLHEKTTKLSQLLKSQSWNSLKKMLGGVDGTAFEIKICYDELKADFMRFIVEHFVGCVKRFEVPKADKQAYLESIDAFTIELDRVW